MVTFYVYQCAIGGCNGFDEVPPTVYDVAFLLEYLRHAGGKCFEVGVSWGYLCFDIHSFLSIGLGLYCMLTARALGLCALGNLSVYDLKAAIKLFLCAFPAVVAP